MNTYVYIHPVIRKIYTKWDKIVFENILYSLLHCQDVS